MKRSVALPAAWLIAASWLPWGWAPGSNASSGAVVLAVPGVAKAEDKALREALAAWPGLSVADEETATALLAAATRTGLHCGSADGSCWLRVAVLGGLDEAVLPLANGDERTLLRMTATQQLRTPVLDGDMPAAVRRLYGAESAARLVNLAPGAQVTVDGQAVSGPVVQGIVPGAHVFAVQAPGLLPRTVEVLVLAGEVAVVDLRQEASVAPPPPPPPPPPPAEMPGPALHDVLFYSGIGVAGLGLAVGGALMARPQAEYCKELVQVDGFPFIGCTGGTDRELANRESTPGAIVMATGVVVGVGLLVAGLVLSPPDEQGDAEPPAPAQ